MKCPQCKIEMRVEPAGVKLLHDDTPDVPTEAYDVQTFFCRNRQCPNFGKEAARTEHRLNLYFTGNHTGEK